MPASQLDKARRFQALHAAPDAFVIANAWDAGSARILAGVGFAALATSSGAAAGMLGRRDGAITREESLSHARAVLEATDLPVSADLENGFARDPQAAAETYRQARQIGLAGASIEDYDRLVLTGNCSSRAPIPGTPRHAWAARQCGTPSAETPRSAILRCFPVSGKQPSEKPRR